MSFREIINKILNDEKVTFEFFDVEKESLKRSNVCELNYYNEKWKKIKNFNYEVSNYGRIRNATNKRMKQLRFHRYGMQVVLWNGSHGYTFTISRLVAIYFIRQLNKNEKVIHINKNIRDNYVKNLKIERCN